MGAIQGRGNRPRLLGGKTVPDDQPRPHGSHPGPRSPATPPRWSDGTKGSVHAPTAAPQGFMGAATPERQPSGAQGPATSPRRPDGTQETGHAPTTTRRDPGDRPHLHGGQNKIQGTGYTPKAASQHPWHQPPNHVGQTGTRRTTTPPQRLDPGNRPCFHGRQTGCRGPQTPARRPPGAQGTSCTPNGGHLGSGGQATPLRWTDGAQWTVHTPRLPIKPRAPATPPRRPPGLRGSGHASTAACRGPGDSPCPHGGKPGPMEPATPPR